MRTIISGFLTLLFSSGLMFANDKQFPESGYYYQAGQDRGFAKYQAPSLYGTKKVVLTFDDGPHPTRTPQLLDTLKKYQVKATFFVMVSNINSSNEKIIKRILDEGHILASHDWTHRNNNNENESQYRSGLTKSIVTLEELEAKYGHNINEMYYRFPYGDYGRRKDYHHLNIMKEVSQTLYGENCINFAFWDIDTADWVKDMTANDIAQTVKAHIEGGTAYRHKKTDVGYRKFAYQIKKPIEGGVILMHDIHQRTIDSVELILDYAKENNVEVVPLHQVKEYEYGNRLCELI